MKNQLAAAFVLAIASLIAISPVNAEPFAYVVNGADDNVSVIDTASNGAGRLYQPGQCAAEGQKAQRCYCTAHN
jgi:DNA-binding beta-propeller fold protein YncE